MPSPLKDRFHDLLHRYSSEPHDCASKLGEDGAQPGEVLITKEVAQGLPAGAQVKLQPLRIALSGIEIEGYSVQYRKAPAG